VPTVLFAIISALSAIVIFSQPQIVQQLKEQQEKAMDKQVQAGKMTRAQADQAQAIAEKFMGPGMMKIFGVVGAVIMSAVRLCWWGFALTLLARWFLNAAIPYGKALELVGLATMITILGAIVTVLLTINMQRLFATPSLGLVVPNFDATRKSHLMLGAANVFFIWQAVVTGIGLAKVTAAPVPRAVFVVFAFWVMQQAVLILLGMGQFAM
jgi:hypothetical protein